MICLLLMLFLPLSLQARLLDTLPCLDTAPVFRSSDSGITIAAQYFTSDDCKTYFGTDLIKQGYRPLLVQMNNQTDEIYIVEPDAIRELILVCPHTIYDILKFNVWSYVSLLAFSVWYRAPYAVPMVVAVPAIVLHRYNQHLWQNIQGKLLDPQHALYMYPGQSITKILFCFDYSCSSQFSIELMDESMTKTSQVTIDLLDTVREQTGNPLLPGLMVV